MEQLAFSLGALDSLSWTSEGTARQGYFRPTNIQHPGGPPPTAVTGLDGIKMGAGSDMHRRLRWLHFDTYTKI